MNSEPKREPRKRIKKLPQKIKVIPKAKDKKLSYSMFPKKKPIGVPSTYQSPIKD